MKMMHNPASPGELLREFMGDRSVTELAKHIGVARATLSRILNGRNAVSVDLSIRLGEALSLSPDFFAKAQLQYDVLAQVAEETPQHQTACRDPRFPVRSNRFVSLNAQEFPERVMMSVSAPLLTQEFRGC